ncbi:hypothetical protein [Paraburkholderia sp.]|uniref:hypothetical protein n=1 Tax=Paraburkholderia sp. TaxID=1926495 RepID=UPI002F405949
MTGNTRTDIFLRTLAMLGLVALLGGCGEVTGQYKKGSQIMEPDMTLWQTIDAVVQQIPFTKAKLKNLLMTQLVEKDTSRVAIPNTAFQLYGGGPVKLADDVVISNVDLRIRHRAGHPGFLVLQIDGDCIDLDAVRQHYSNLKVTDRPRGISPEEATSYTAVLHWGKLSFSFKERNPNCVSSVAFAPELNEAGSAER